nr:serine/threonine-protein kinase [Kofleriaceae bacterium]
MGAADPAQGELTRLGSFEIVRHLARGGMADIYLARAGDKLVVLKRILPSHADNPRFVKLFLDEARLVASLDHPHIARVFELGTVDGNHFFAMEYVHGQDLRSTLRRTDRMRKKFPLDHAIGVAHDMASALHYAHERRGADDALLGIVHRDVSPSNVLVSYDGVSKLVDFGVAKAATSSVKTRTGTLKGKISYMSPEQARGAAIDRRSDVFALGIVLWEMITTRRLFRADNDLATIQMIINDPVPRPTESRPDCPPELEAIAMRALSRDVGARYQTADEMRADIARVGKELGANTSEVGLARNMRELFAAELDAWTESQAAGMTLLQHVVKTGTDMTSPVSGSEVEFADSGEAVADADDGDDDDDVHPIADDEDDDHDGDLQAADDDDGDRTTAAPPPIIPLDDMPPVGAHEAAPAPAPAPVAAPAHVAAPDEPEELHDFDHDDSAAAEKTEARPVTETPFPVAPVEWRPHTEPPVSGPTDFLSKHRTEVFWVVAGGLVVMLLTALVIAISGAGHSAPARAPDTYDAPASP